MAYPVGMPFNRCICSRETNVTVVRKRRRLLLHRMSFAGRSEKGAKAEKGASACVQTKFPCLLIVVLYTAKDGSSERGLLYQDSLQATGAYSQVPRTVLTCNKIK